jgi:hypothetical protein
VWWLGIAVGGSLGGLVAAWAVRRRMERQLAVEHDRRARDAQGHRAEVAQLRRSRSRVLADALVVQAATAIVDNALRGAGRERER